MAEPQSRPRITRSRPAPQPAPVEEESDSGFADTAMDTLRSVGSAGLSGLSMVGNLLDVVPSMARDVAVWDNPFDQLLSPLSHANTGKSASGRDVLARNILTSSIFTPNKETGISGWRQDPLEGVQDVLGFALEMASGGFGKAPGAVYRGLRPASKLGRAATTPTAATAAANAAKTASPAATPAATGILGKIRRGFARANNTLDELSPGANVSELVDDALPNPAAAPRELNLVDDPILQSPGTEAPLSPGKRGMLDRLGDTLSKYDPGTHVGKIVEREIGKLSDRLSLPDIFDQQVTQRFLRTKVGKAYQQRAAQKAAGRYNPSSGTANIAPDLTVQQELQSLIGSGSAARGSRVITDLNEDQSLATRVGNAFGGQVLFWGGGHAPSAAAGVRVFNTGNRVWVNSEAASSAYNNIVGHELVHLLRDVDNDAFTEMTKLIQRHAPTDEIAKRSAKYMEDYRRAFGRPFNKGKSLEIEEGVARTVQYAFDRPAFWQELTSNPKTAASVRDVFNQAMAKLKNTLPEPEYEVIDRELSTFFFGQADKMAEGATMESLGKAMASRYSSAQIDPLADTLAAPGTATHTFLSEAEQLGERIAAGVKANMVYKVGGHTYPVVQAFSRARTNLLESMGPDVILPAMSLNEMAHNAASKVPDVDPVGLFSSLEQQIVEAVEKGNYANLAASLPPEIRKEFHAATRQLELVQSSLYEMGVRSGLKLDFLKDDYVQYFNHSLHPSISQKLKDLGEASPSHAPSELAASHKASQSQRTSLFRNAYNGRATWNAATVDPDVLKTLKDSTLGRPEVRIEAAANTLRQKYLSEIDPRIPVIRDDKFIMLQRNPDGTLTPVPFSAKEMKSLTRVDSQHDLTSPAGRIAEHTNEPIVYTSTSIDEAGRQVTTEFEQLTARVPGDKRYGDHLADNDLDRGFYKSAEEGYDRHRVLSGWMKEIGTDTLEKTSGVFSGSALNSWIENTQAKLNSVAVARTMPELLLGTIRQGFLKPATGDAVRTGKEFQLRRLFDSPYFSVIDRAAVYNKLATLDPQIQQLASSMPAKKFIQMLDDMVLDPEIVKDLKIAGSFMNMTPAIEKALKTAGSAGSLWKAGVLTHPGRYVRDALSGMAKLVYSRMFSWSAEGVARDLLYSRPNAELLNYPAIKEYLDRFGMEHTPENATRAGRTMFGDFMSQSGGSIYRDYTDATAPAGDVARGMKNLHDPLPGDGRSGFMDMLRGVGRTIIGREGDTTFNPFDIAGVQHAINKRNAAGQIVDKAGDVRTDSRFSPVVAGDIVGKHSNDYVRMTGFFENLRQGKSPVDAWNETTRNQLDYNPRHFGPLEAKILKKLFPFYSFMSRESAWLAHELMTNPEGRLGKIIRLIRHSQPSSNEFLPEHLTEKPAIPFGGEQEDGTQNYLTGLGLMFEDPITMAGNLLSGDTKAIARDFLADSNPLIKGPAEWGLGRSAFQGGPLGGRDLADMDPVLGRIFTQLGIQTQLPGGQAAPAFNSRGLEFLLSNSPVSRLLSSAKTALDDRKSVGERAANILSGLRITSVSPEQKLRGIREELNAAAKELGVRPFTSYEPSNDLIASLESNPDAQRKLKLVKDEIRRLNAVSRTMKITRKKKEEAAAN